VLKVNGHLLKPFYEGWTSEITASMELAEPIYEAWACDVSSQWHKTKALTGRQPSTQKKLDLLSFISTLRTMLCLKCGGIERILVFCCVKKNSIFDLFELPLIYENMSIMHEN
jgi:hypothetical protein